MESTCPNRLGLMTPADNSVGDVPWRVPHTPVRSPHGREAVSLVLSSDAGPAVRAALIWRAAPIRPARGAAS